MNTLWFGIVAVMFAIFAVLDGFDMGVGIVHLVVARTDAERRVLLRSIGPHWVTLCAGFRSTRTIPSFFLSGTNFRIGPDPGILDWFTIALGLTSVSAL